MHRYFYVPERSFSPIHPANDNIRSLLLSLLNSLSFSPLSSHSLPSYLRQVRPLSSLFLPFFSAHHSRRFLLLSTLFLTSFLLYLYLSRALYPLCLSSFSPLSIPSPLFPLPPNFFTVFFRKSADFFFLFPHLRMCWCIIFLNRTSAIKKYYAPINKISGTY